MAIQLMGSVPPETLYWWYTHTSAMIGGCIGALTVFLVINPEPFPAGIQSAVPAWVVWLAPTSGAHPRALLDQRPLELRGLYDGRYCAKIAIATRETIDLHIARVCQASLL